MKNVLFLCARNRLRSPTAETVFAAWPGIATDSAGVQPDAVVRVTLDQIEWADMIFVMERAHAKKLNAHFGDALKSKKTICLNIPDDYALMQPELIELLEVKVGPYLE